MMPHLMMIVTIIYEGYFLFMHEFDAYVSTYVPTYSRFPAIMRVPKLS